MSFFARQNSYVFSSHQKFEIFLMTMKELSIFYGHYGCTGHVTLRKNNPLERLS